MLTPLLKKTQKEVELAKNHLAHVEAKVCDLRGVHKELQAVLRRMADGEAEIARLQQLIPKKTCQAPHLL